MKTSIPKNILRFIGEKDMGALLRMETSKGETPTFCPYSNENASCGMWCAQFEVTGVEFLVTGKTEAHIKLWCCCREIVAAVRY